MEQKIKRSGGFRHEETGTLDLLVFCSNRELAQVDHWNRRSGGQEDSVMKKPELLISWSSVQTVSLLRSINGTEDQEVRRISF
jgi:hypothetical protein